MGILWGQGWRSFPLEKALLDKVSQEILLKFHIFCFVPKSPMLLTYFFSSLAMGVHKTHEFYWERTCDAQTEIIFLYSILKIFIKHLSMKYLSPNGTCFAFLNIIGCIHSCYWPIRLLKSSHKFTLWGNPLYYQNIICKTQWPYKPIYSTSFPW